MPSPIRRRLLCSLGAAAVGVPARSRPGEVWLPESRTEHISVIRSA